jgi:hypothetical protein
MGAHLHVRHRPSAGKRACAIVHYVLRRTRRGRRGLSGCPNGFDLPDDEMMTVFADLSYLSAVLSSRTP